jgi:hypothetical protein
MIKLKSILFEEQDPFVVAMPYFKEFYSIHGYTLNFNYLGLKDEEMVFAADLKDLGQLSLIVTEAQVIARVTPKKALFGVTYLLNGLEKLDATICRMKQKDGQIVAEMFDDKKFENNETKFLNLIKNK